MNPPLMVQGDFERNLTKALRRRAIEHIGDRPDLEGLAEELGLAPIGVQALLSREEWSLSQACRVVEILNLVDPDHATAMISAVQK